jgi:hypothetical protein
MKVFQISTIQNSKQIFKNRQRTKNGTITKGPTENIAIAPGRAGDGVVRVGFGLLRFSSSVRLELDDKRVK